MKTNIGIIVSILILLSACNSTKNVEIFTKESVNHFKIIRIYEIDSIIKNPTLTLDLVKNTVSGKTPCNQYGGTVILDKNSIKFDRIRATKMYCVDFAETEIAFTRSLSFITKYKIENKQLLLYDKADNLLLVGEKLD